MTITKQQYDAGTVTRDGIRWVTQRPLRNPFTGRIEPAPTVDSEAS